MAFKPKTAYVSTRVRAAVLCVWEFVKKEHMEILRWEREHGFRGT